MARDSVRTTTPMDVAQAEELARRSTREEVVGATAEMSPIRMRELLEHASRPKQAVIVDDAEPPETAAPVPAPAPEPPRPRTPTAPPIETAESSLVGRTLLWFLIAVACFAAGYWALALR